MKTKRGKLNRCKALAAVVRDVSESLADLYAARPEIAGQFFGAALSERIKEAAGRTNGKKVKP